MFILVVKKPHAEDFEAGHLYHTFEAKTVVVGPLARDALIAAWAPYVVHNRKCEEGLRDARYEFAVFADGTGMCRHCGDVVDGGTARPVPGIRLHVLLKAAKKAADAIHPQRR